MKIFLIVIFTVFSLLSCRTAYKNPEYMIVYRDDAIGSGKPTEYLILKYANTQGKNTYDYYNVAGGGGGGIWLVSGDTIRLYPQYSYMIYDSGLIDVESGLEDKDAINITTFLKKGDELQDITDYDAMLGFHNPATIRKAFKKMSQQ